ncbi:fibrillarin-like rRNA/tRNA 2'-O-methyltransferase [Candidatus Bathyarchaeota archaeon]|nr:MAG: fibrillarin-like rRNA/tRNA 2'-O-methyltransferase [Candidatus Bathyarchaeota archaeon]
MPVRVEEHEKFPSVFWLVFEDGSRKLATRNLAPGRTVYGERLMKVEGVEYRLWDAYRSKLAASILKGIEDMPIRPGHKVLYLGAASGTTASHVSDIVGPEGHVFCVEFAPRVIQDLVNNVCPYRPNMSPILADARMPYLYAHLVSEVDAIYCDIAQPEQAKVLADNADLFLKDGGEIMLAIKARSIDVTKRPSELYRREMEVLEARGFEIEDKVHLEPFDKDHAMVVAKFRRK